MLLLALDTSTRQASVALCTEETLLGEYTWLVGNNHSIELLERIRRLMAECGHTMQAIDVIAVATGPGSFNGLRVAVTAAKALAFALQVPLIGVSTLDVIAAHQRQWRGPICAVLEAGRSELYAACYTFDETYEEQNSILTYTLRRPEALTHYLQEHLSALVSVPGERQLPATLFCGEMSETSRAALHQHLPESSLFLESFQSARHASVLAYLAFQRFLGGIIDDPLSLEPLYLRRPSITTSVRKQPLLGSKTPGSSNLTETEREEGALHH